MKLDIGHIPKKESEGAISVTIKPGHFIQIGEAKVFVTEVRGKQTRMLIICNKKIPVTRIKMDYQPRESMSEESKKA